MTDQSIRFTVFRMGAAALTMAASGAAIAVEHGPLHLLRVFAVV